MNSFRLTWLHDDPNNDTIYSSTVVRSHLLKEGERQHQHWAAKFRLVVIILIKCLCTFRDPSLAGGGYPCNFAVVLFADHSLQTLPGALKAS